MIRIRVKVQGALRKPFGKDDFEFETDEGNTVRDLLLKLGYLEPQLRFIVPAVNGTQASLQCLLKDGDAVALVLPISGG